MFGPYTRHPRTVETNYTQSVIKFHRKGEAL